MSIRRGVLFAALAVTTALGACAPVVNERGFVYEQPKIDGLQVGVDNKDTIQAALGTPSTMGTFNDKTWYYISSTEEVTTYHSPETVRRDVIALTFGEDGTLSTVERYDLAAGQEVALIDRETPTRGREMSILQQLFSNIGKTGPIASGGADQ